VDRGRRRASVVELQRVPGSTIDDLLMCLRRDEWHIFHFIGHGGETRDDTVLLLEDEHQPGARAREVPHPAGVLLGIKKLMET
jgi:hypothetical protein